MKESAGERVDTTGLFIDPRNLPTDWTPIPFTDLEIRVFRHDPLGSFWIRGKEQYDDSDR